MSPSPSLPWEVIERVIDHSASSSAALKSFTLICRDLRPRSTILLLSCVKAEFWDHSFANLCAFLQANPHLLPFVRSVTIPVDKFSPDPLLRILPNLSDIKFTVPGLWHQKHYHIFVLNYCRRLGQHIQTLSLKKIPFTSLSAFSDILLLFPRIESLSCEDLHVDGDRVLEELITRRLSERLHLKTLTIGPSNDDRVLVLLREAVKHGLVTLVYENPWHEDECKHFKETFLASPSDWVQLTSFIWKPGSAPGASDMDPQLQRATSILTNWHPPELREVTVGIIVYPIPLLLPPNDISNPPSPELCAELEKILMTFLQPMISFSPSESSRTLNIRRHHSWLSIVERFFPALARRRALRINAEYSGNAGHDSYLSTPIVTSANSQWAVTGSGDGTIIVWDLQSGCISQEWLTEDTTLHSLAISPDSRYIMSTGMGRGRMPTSATKDECDSPWATVWDLHQGGRRVKSLKGESDNNSYYYFYNQGFRNCAWSPDGTWIATGAPAGDDVVHIWETTTFERRHPASTSTWKGSKLLACSGDGRWVATAAVEERPSTKPDPARPTTVWIWSVGSGELHRALQGHAHAVCAAAFNPGSTRVATGSGDSTIRIWDAQTGEQLLLLQEGAKQWIDAVAFSGDGRMVLSHSRVLGPFQASDGVKVWHASNGALLASLAGTRADERSTPHTACFSPCGSYVASAAKGKAVLLWRTSDWSCIAEVSGGGAPVSHVAISPDGRVLCWGTEAGTVFFRRIHDLISAGRG